MGDASKSEELVNRRNYLTLLFRRGSSSFFNGLSQQYVDIYALKLGLAISALGSIRSISLFSSAIVSSAIGYIADMMSRKTAYIISMIIEALSAAAFTLANDWTLAALGFILSTISLNALGGLEALLLTESTRGRHRAFSIGISDALSMLALVISPLVAAYMVNVFGGISREGIRPLFMIQFIGLAVTLVIASLVLKEHFRKGNDKSLGIILKDSVAIFKRPWLRRWLLIDILGGYVFSTTMPYQMIYAVEVKGADEFTIGYMGFAANLGNLIASPIIGHLADKLGRVKTIVMFRPLFYISVLIFLLAPSPDYLILSWLLRGIWMASRTAFQTLTMELVPTDVRGRWIGVRNFLSLMMGIPAPWLGGMMYEAVFPEAPFLLSLGIDALVRYPLIYMTPETLNRKEYLEKYAKG